MSTSLSVRRVLSLALILTGLGAVAQAGTYSAVVVYGDSLSDNGNLYAATMNTQPPDPPYDMGRRSNGPLAVEQLATSLGAPLVDFAWIGATTGVGNFGDGGTPTTFGADNLPGMQTVFAATKSSLTPFVNGSLFVVWGGPDDFLSPSPLDTTAAEIISRAVSDELGIVTSLELLGVQHILVAGMPDLGLTPYFKSLGPAEAAEGSALTDAFNAALSSSLPAGVDYYDTAALVRSMVANPAAYGFTDVTDPCYDGTTVCSNPSQYLFYDSFHPTTAADAFAAEGFQSALVPEPSTFVLIAGGLILCGSFRKRLSSRAKH